MKKIMPFIIASLLLAMTLIGCRQTKPSASNNSGEKISVVATIFPPYDFTRAIAGEDADINALLSLGGTHEPEAEVKNSENFSENKAISA